MQYFQSVEDSKRIHRHIQYITDFDAAIQRTPSKDDGDWFGRNLEATAVHDGQHFDIKSKTLHQYLPHNGLNDFCAEKLQPGLCIQDVEPEHDE